MCFLLPKDFKVICKYQRSFRTDCKYPVPILCTEKPGTQVKYEVQSMAENGNSSSGVPKISLHETAPLFLDEEATALRLVFAAHSLISINYFMFCCCTMGLLAKGQGWQECHGRAGEGFGIWKPAPRPSETKQCYTSLTLLAWLSAKCLFLALGNIFPYHLSLVPLPTENLRQMVILVD